MTVCLLVIGILCPSVTFFFPFKNKGEVPADELSKQRVEIIDKFN